VAATRGSWGGSGSSIESSGSFRRRRLKARGGGGMGLFCRRQRLEIERWRQWWF
jgi:hypothetical protein